MTTITQPQQNSDRNRIAQLVRAAQAGDRRAMGQLFVRYEGHVMAIALRRLGDYGEAQELCQDVFLQAMEKLHQLREPECFGGWLRSITHRMAINRAVRRGPLVSTSPQVMESNCVEGQTPLTRLLAVERAHQVRDGLSRLKALDRDTLVAFYVDGRSLLEMSDRFDAPVGTIKRRLHVARKRLAKEVEQIVAI